MTRGIPILKLSTALLLLGSGFLISGCRSDDLDFTNTPVASSHYERYPINVAKLPMKLDVKPSKGGLQRLQVDAVTNFARSAQMASVTGVTIQRPSGGGDSASSAAQVYRIMVDNGVPPDRISQQVYRGPAMAPVRIGFIRSVAITKECGEWSRNLADTYSNKPYPNFGCSMQHNIAAMVQNPEEFAVPAPVYPVHAADRDTSQASLPPTIKSTSSP